MAKKKSPGRVANAKKNLQQKGQPSNSPGRTPGTGYKQFTQELFASMLDRDVTYNKKKVKFSEAFIQQVMESVRTGGWAARLFFERMFSENILDDIDNLLDKSRREDEDFLSYRILKMAHDYQQRVILTKKKKIYNMAGRRAGKTEANILKVVEKFITIKDARILILGLTFSTTVDLYFNSVISYLDDLGYSNFDEKSKSDGTIVLGKKEIHFKGNSTVDEREKVRGSNWDLVVIDEAQSQKALPYLIDSIVEPTLLDKNGQLVLTGTGPRVRGTYWEELWTREDNNVLKLNWNISDNPFIPNYQEILEEIKKNKGIDETNSLFIREYLGQIAYDDDALVYRIEDDNIIDEKVMKEWIDSKPVTDVHFSAGLDYGFNDADAFGIIMYADNDPTLWLIYEYRNNRTGITELVDEIKKGIEYINTDPLYSKLEDRHFNIFADTGGAGKKISFELATQHSLPVLDAYKANKDLGVEMLQEDVRKKTFKIRKDGIFADEALRTVFARNEKDELTRVVDDNTFHPDLLDAVLYALRPIYMFNQ